MSTSRRHDVKSRVLDVEPKLFIENTRHRDAERARMRCCPHGSSSLSTSVTHEALFGEIERLKEEKRIVCEWLERGVAEAKRVSTQMSRLSEEFCAAEPRGRDVAQLLREMNERYKEPQREVNGVHAHLASASHHVVVEKDADAVQRGSRTPLEKEYDPPLGKHLVAVERMEEPQDKLALLETVETTMEQLAACSHRSLHELERLSAALHSENMCDESGKLEADKASFDLEEGTHDARRCPQVIMTSAKAIVDRCDSCVCTIWSGLCRVAFEQACLRRQRDIQFHESHMVVEQDLATTVENCAAHLRNLKIELETWKEKQQKFAPLLHTVESGCLDNVLGGSLHCEVHANHGGDFEGEKEEAAKNIFAVLKRRDECLREEHSQLKAANEALKKELEASMSDYKFVRELKHAYRDLETKKTRLTHANESLRMKNCFLKRRVWEASAKIIPQH